MADRTTRVCDVCESGKCKRFKIPVIRVEENGLEVEVTARTVDLCKKHLKRLYHFLDRGCLPPRNRVEVIDASFTVSEETEPA